MQHSWLISCLLMRKLTIYSSLQEATLRYCRFLVLVFMQKFRSMFAKNWLDSYNTGIENLRNQTGYDKVSFQDNSFLCTDAVNLFKKEKTAPNIQRAKNTLWHFFLIRGLSHGKNLMHQLPVVL